MELKPRQSRKNIVSPTVIVEELTEQDVNPQVKESDLWDDLKLPKLPTRLGGRLPNIDVAQQWFDLVTNPNAQDRIYIYVYRVWPKINRTRNNKNIDKFPLRLYNFNKIISNHGGGDYRMMITDASNSHGYLFDVNFTIDPQLYDPVINLAELDLDAKENRSFVEALKNKGLLTTDGKATMNQTVNPVPTTVVNSSDRIADVLGDVVKQFLSKQATPPATDSNVAAITSLLLEKLKQDDPNKGLLGIAELIKSIMPTHSPVVAQPDNTIVNMLLDEVKELRASNTRMMEKVLDLQSSKQSNGLGDNFINQVDTLLKVANKLQHRQDNHSEVAEKQSIVDRLIDKGLPILGPVLQGMMMKGFKMDQQQSVNDLAALQQSVGTNQSTNPTVQALDGNQQHLYNEPVSNQTPELVNPSLISLVNSYGGMLAPKIVSGVSGWIFALDLENLYGDVIWKQIIQFSQDEILTAFKQVPAFWNAIQFKGELAIKQWINEFIEYRKFAAESDLANQQDEDEDELEETSTLQ